MLPTLIGRAPVRGGHTIREAAAPSSPGLKGINLKPLPGRRVPWRSACVRGTGWCLSSRQNAPVSNRCGAVGNMLKLRAAFDVDLSTYRPGQPSDSSYESVHLAAGPEIVARFRIRYAIGHT